MRTVLVLLLAVVAAIALALADTRPAEAPAYVPTPPPVFTPMPLPSAEPTDVPRHAPLGPFRVPIADHEIPDEEDLLPEAARDYRAGVHEGIDFVAPAGTPVLAAAAGRIARIDAAFVDWGAAEHGAAFEAARALGHTPDATLDRTRGRQVWIDHGRGIVTRYAHLERVAPLAVGSVVEAGMTIGYVGSSGYPDGGPHLHFEIRIGDSYLGDGLTPAELAREVRIAFR